MEAMTISRSNNNASLGFPYKLINSISYDHETPMINEEKESEYLVEVGSSTYKFENQEAFPYRNQIKSSSTNTPISFAFYKSGAELAVFFIQRAALEPKSDEISKLLTSVSLLEGQGCARMASRLSMRFIEQSFKNHDLEKVNRLLRIIEPQKYQEQVIVGVLRSTFRARKLLPAWSSLLSKSKQSLEQRGADVGGLLIGLL